MNKIQRRIQILRFIGEQGAVTVEQISRRFGNKESAVRTLFGKLNLEQVRVGAIRYGLWRVGNQDILDEVNSYYPDRLPLLVRAFVLPELLHSLRVTDIRILLEKSKEIKVTNWVSESALRSMPAQIREIPYAKIPDAIFEVEFGKGIRRFYLEYERTFKNLAKYKRIFDYYDCRNDIGAKQIIYVTEDCKVKNRLSQLPKMDPKYVLYSWDELKDKYQKRR
ncbi:MAG: hypothetical protein GY858_08865 [Candidatus Omnitrophica bacterium]|nr:hypothetical protein [Candidatus Omnitrophota bacterium]